MLQTATVAGVCALCLTLTLATQVVDNVVFKRVNVVTTTKAKWTVTFVIDMDSVGTVISSIGENIVQTLNRVEQVRGKNWVSHETVNHFQGLFNELRSLHETYRQLSVRLADHQTLRGRSRRSLLPFVGDALSFLFGPRHLTNGRRCWSPGCRPPFSYDRIERLGLFC